MKAGTGRKASKKSGHWAGYQPNHEMNNNLQFVVDESHERDVELDKRRHDLEIDILWGFVAPGCRMRNHPRHRMTLNFRLKVDSWRYKTKLAIEMTFSRQIVAPSILSHDLFDSHPPLIETKTFLSACV